MALLVAQDADHHVLGDRVDALGLLDDRRVVLDRAGLGLDHALDDVDDVRLLVGRLQVGLLRAEVERPGHDAVELLDPLGELAGVAELLLDVGLERLDDLPRAHPVRVDRSGDVAHHRLDLHPVGLREQLDDVLAPLRLILAEDPLGPCGLDSHVAPFERSIPDRRYPRRPVGTLLARMATAPKTLVEKVWDDHVIGDDLLFVDLHLIHEVTSPQAFDGLRTAGRKVRRPDRTIATADHNVATGPGEPDELSRAQLAALERNCAEFGVRLYPLGHRRNGIVHVIGPQLGLTQPGMTIVCGDSHTSTHGAFGALAFGIGTSEVEHVLATQCLGQRKPRTMRINYSGELAFGVTAKDLILATIGRLGVGGMQGFAVEYAGEAIRALSMENRMTICNMTIEGGGRAGMVAPDETTFDYIRGKAGAPDDFESAVERWRELPSDEGASFDTEVEVDAAAIS